MEILECLLFRSGCMITQKAESNIVYIVEQSLYDTISIIQNNKYLSFSISNLESQPFRIGDQVSINIIDDNRLRVISEGTLLENTKTHFTIETKSDIINVPNTFILKKAGGYQIRPYVKIMNSGSITNATCQYIATSITIAFILDFIIDKNSNFGSLTMRANIINSNNVDISIRLLRICPNNITLESSRPRPPQSLEYEEKSMTYEQSESSESPTEIIKVLEFISLHKDSIYSIPLISALSFEFTTLFIHYTEEQFSAWEYLIFKAPYFIPSSTINIFEEKTSQHGKSIDFLGKFQTKITNRKDDVKIKLLKSKDLIIKTISEEDRSEVSHIKKVKRNIWKVNGITTIKNISPTKKLILIAQSTNGYQLQVSHPTTSSRDGRYIYWEQEINAGDEINFKWDAEFLS